MVKVGDKVRITRFNNLKVDEVRTVVDVNERYIGDFYINEEIDGSNYFDADNGRWEIIAETSTAEVTAKDCSPAVIDMLSSLAQLVASINRKVESLEDQVDSLAKNQVSQAEYLESHDCDIRELDERTQLLNVIQAFHKGGYCE
jgi:hypothetical protein